MTIGANLEGIRKELQVVGYQPISKPFNIAALDRGERVQNCKIMARKDEYDILYLEADSSWKGIATNVAKNHRKPCLVVTSYRHQHIILSTVRGAATMEPRPRHLVIDQKSKTHSMQKFTKMIRVEVNDDIVSIDNKVQKAFDKFSEYGEALKNFANSLGLIIKTIDSSIGKAITGNEKYRVKAKKMLDMCRKTVSDRMDMDDIRSMLVQHILTYRLFALVYDVDDFHVTNAVSRSLDELEGTLNLSNVVIDYRTMELIAESLTDTEQRQEFLKKVYETFYGVYDPARADKDGIVYTPSEAVNFMVRSTDELLAKHFGVSLSDDGVTVLDPSTGTGTFLVYVLRQIRPDRVVDKYGDLHANELSILPYYIAALNIEHAYKEITGEYREFDNMCWMDTLDSGLRDYSKLTSYFDDDNVMRVSRQRDSAMQVIITNPPYNAIQTSLNNANPADKYEHLDVKIRKSYYEGVKTTNKNKSFDMYKRFLKWSSERIGGVGIVVLITNNSFLDAKADAGIRKGLYKEFDHIYIVNLRGNARLAGDAWRRDGDKIFGEKARVGICISFFVKTGKSVSDLQYAEVAGYASRAEKLKWLDTNTCSSLEFGEIIPNNDAVWLNQTDNDFGSLPPVISKTCADSIFDVYTPGVTTAKDDWVYDIDTKNLKSKMKYYISVYSSMLKKYKTLKEKPTNLIEWVDKQIKWSCSTLEGIQRNRTIKYSANNIKPTLYRPFVQRQQYYAGVITHRKSKFSHFFKNSQKNLLLAFPNPKTNVQFDVIGTYMMTDYGCLDGTQNVPMWQYDGHGGRVPNVTKYGLDLFRSFYNDQKISADQIFYYTYAVFNDPKYERQYRHNLRKEFPRIPLAKNFEKWSALGRALFELHCNFESVEEYALKRVDKASKKNNPVLLLKKYKKPQKLLDEVVHDGVAKTVEPIEDDSANHDIDSIRIFIDDSTSLENIPIKILDWKFKSKTPLEWILDFYKKPKNQISSLSSDDENVRKKFDKYCFADHKEEVISLLKKVTTVCVETARFREDLERMEWGPCPYPESANRKSKSADAARCKLNIGGKKRRTALDTMQGRIS